MSIVTRFDYEKDNVTVFKKKNKNSSDISFCGRGIVTAPYRVVAEFVKDVESTFLWDKYLVEAKYLKTISETENCTDYLGYQMHSTTHCFSLIQRDMLYFIRCQYRDGKYIMSGMSVEDEQYPPQRFRPRCELRIGSGFVVESLKGNQTHSLVTFFGNVDVKGVPQFITNQILRRQPLAIRSIQRNFEVHESTQEPPPRTLPEPLPEPSPHDTTLPYEEDLSLGMFVGKTDKK